MDNRLTLLSRRSPLINRLSERIVRLNLADRRHTTHWMVTYPPASLPSINDLRRNNDWLDRSCSGNCYSLRSSFFVLRSSFFVLRSSSTVAKPILTKPSSFTRMLGASSCAMPITCCVNRALTVWLILFAPRQTCHSTRKV